MSSCHSLLLALAFASCCVPGLRADECREESVHYNGYVVQRVEIRTPISFFAAATFGFDQLKSRLPLQETQQFSVKKLSEGNSLIGEFIRSVGLDAVEKLKFTVVTGKPVDCDSTAHTLSVVYTVFTNVYRPYLSHTFEQRTAEVQRPATTGAEGGTKGRFLIKPSAGYNHTRRGFGGLDLSSEVPLGIFQHVEMHSSLSSDSTVDDLDATGSWNPRRKALEHAEWRLGFHYLDLPAGGAKLKEGKLTAQFFGSTKELSSLGAALRFGASLEGGHQQTGAVAVTSNLTPNSSYGALKLYVGATARSGRQVFTTSYGAEFGSTLSGGTLDFAKHIVDFGYSVRFLRKPKPGASASVGEGVHKPWDVEIRADGGIIQNLVQVPVAERFYGGNQVQSFIGGDTWVIPAGAFIRSIAENRLGGFGPNSGLGGTRFYSGNLTVAKVLWGRSLLPKELAQDPDFLQNLQGAINTAKGTLEDLYKSQDPGYTAAISELNAVTNQVQQLGTEIGNVSRSTPRVTASVDAIKSELSTISRILDAVQNKGKKTQIVSLVHVQVPKLDTEMTNLEEELKSEGQTAAVAAISSLHQSIDASRQKIQEDPS